MFHLNGCWEEFSAVNLIGRSDTLRNRPKDKEQNMVSNNGKNGLASFPSTTVTTFTRL